MNKHRKRMRSVEDGSVRYVTFSCYHRLPLFGNDAIKNVFVETLAAGEKRFGFELAAWVVMPEHVHLLLRPRPHAARLTPVLAWIKAKCGQRVISRWRELRAPILARITHPTDGPRFWQRGGGHDRNIFTESEFLEKLHYIHWNPVHRGLVRDPRDWMWSSQRAHSGEPHPLVTLNKLCWTTGVLRRDEAGESTRGSSRDSPSDGTVPSPGG